MTETGGNEAQRTPDGYHACPECGHHTSAAVAGHCTVLIPLFLEDGEFDGVRYCNCDCYKALHGISLMDKIFSDGTGG